MVVHQSFSYSEAGAGNTSAARVYSKLLDESAEARKAEARKVRTTIHRIPLFLLRRDRARSLSLSRSIPFIVVSSDEVGCRRRR
jgi:hypothetical protein